MKEKLTLSTQCYMALEKAILEGSILPGERLQCEELKQRFQFGLSPLREALSKLAAYNFASFEENKGYTVTKRTKSAFIDTVNTFAAIECLCLRHAIIHGDDRWEGDIVAALHQLKKLETQGKVDYSLWAPANRRFHNALVAACPLEGLKNIRDHLYLQHEWYLQLSYKLTDDTGLHTNHEEHKAIAELVIDRNSELAVKKLHQHITGGIESLIVNLTKHHLIKEDF